MASPSGSTTYNYSSRNRLETATADAKITTFTYYPDGKKKTVVYPNGTDVEYAYWPTNRIKTVENKVTASGSVVSSYAYEYDKNGNRTSQTEVQDGATETTAYSYDDIDRLTSFLVTDSTGTTTKTEYTFEGYNRKTEKVTQNSAVTASKTYTYDETDWLTKVVDNVDPANVRTIAYTYDKNGNTTAKTDSLSPSQNLNFEYDSLNQLVQTKDASNNVLGQYDYNAEGLRVRHRYSDRGDIDYFYDGRSVIDEYDATNNSFLAHYRYADRLLSLSTGTSQPTDPQQVQYYHHDGLGSTVNLTDTTGTTQVSYHLDPWGHIRSQSGLSFNRHIFTDKEHDLNTGLVYFGARYYDADTARFITQDSYLGEPGTPPSLHRYLYAYSNPTVYIDLFGYSALNEWVKTGEGYEEDRQLILGQIQESRDRDMAAGNTAMGFKYSAESTLMGLYGLALNGVTGALKAADFLIDLGRMNEFTENTETGHRTIERIMQIDQTMQSAVAGVKRFARQTAEDPKGMYEKTALAIGDKMIAHAQDVYIKGDAKATATNAEIFGGIVTVEAFAGKAGAVKETAATAKAGAEASEGVFTMAVKTPEVNLIEKEIDEAFASGRAKSGQMIQFSDEFGPIAGSGPKKGQGNIWYHDNIEVPGSGPSGQTVQIRTHSPNPKAPEGSYSKSNYTTQINTTDRLYRLPDGNWKKMVDMTEAERAAAHYPGGN